MRRTKHRRRFHTNRVIANRHRRVRDYYGHAEWDDPESIWWRDRRGRGWADKRDPWFGCPRPQCGICTRPWLSRERRLQDRYEIENWWKEYEDGYDLRRRNRWMPW